MTEEAHSDRLGRPARTEAAPSYFMYIDRVAGDDVLSALETQLAEVEALLSGISEERSHHRYAPGKWSIREVLSHVTDTERVFAFRALWFSRGLDGALPGFDEKVGAAGAGADNVPLAHHIDEFRKVRLANLAFLKNLPPAAWARSGVASGNPITVRALAFLLAGHADHHLAVLRERYL